MNKPINLKTMAWVALVLGLLYVSVAVAVNHALVHDLLADDSAPMTLAGVLDRADGAIAEWLIAVVAVCLVVGTGFAAATSDVSGWAFDDEDDAEHSRYQWHDDEVQHINPSTGLPMLSGGCVDVGGHMYGCID